MPHPAVDSPCEAVEHLPILSSIVAQLGGNGGCFQGIRYEVWALFLHSGRKPRPLCAQQQPFDNEQPAQ